MGAQCVCVCVCVCVNVCAGGWVRVRVGVLCVRVRVCRWVGACACGCVGCFTLPTCKIRAGSWRTGGSVIAWFGCGCVQVWFSRIETILCLFRNKGLSFR